MASLQYLKLNPWGPIGVHGFLIAGVGFPCRSVGKPKPEY